MRKVIKIFLFGGLIVFGLALLLIIFSQTDIFKNWVRDVAVDEINEIIQGEFQLGRIEGNLFTNITLRAIVVKHDNDTMLTIPKMNVHYSPLKFLKSEIRINSLSLDSLHLYLRQFPDSSWNVSKLFLSESPGTSDSASISATFPYQVFLENFQINHGQLKTHAVDPALSRTFQEINTKISAYYSSDNQVFHLKEFNVKMAEPAIQVADVSFLLQRKGEEIRLEKFVFSTAQNRLDGEGTYQEKDAAKSYAFFKSQAFDINEFRVFLPDIKLARIPKFSFKTKYFEDLLELDLDISEGTEQIVVKANITGLERYMNDPISNPINYTLNGRLNNFNPAHYIQSIDSSLSLTGEFSLNGSGLNPSKMEINLDAEFKDFLIRGHPMAQFILNGNYNKGDAICKADLDGDFGRILLQADLRKIQKSPSYNIQVTIVNLDVTEFIQNVDIPSSLNMRILAKGEGDDIHRMQGIMSIQMDPSRLQNLNFDTLFAFIDYSGKSFQIDTLHLDSNVGIVNLAGTINAESSSNITFWSRIDDLSPLSQLLAADTVNANGIFSGEISGGLDSFQTSVDFYLDQIVYNNYRADSAVGVSLLSRNREQWGGKSTASFKKLGVSDFNLDRATVSVSVLENRIDLTADLESLPEFAAHMTTQAIMDSVIQIDITELTLDLMESKWGSGDENIKILISNDNLDFQNFRLTSLSNQKNFDQEINIQGRLSLEGEENLEIRLSDLNVGDFATILDLPADLNGLLSLDMLMQGNANEPFISGNVLVEAGKIDQYHFEHFTTKFSYLDEKFSVNMRLFPNPQDSLTIEGFIPMRLSLMNHGDTFDFEKPFKLQMKTEDFPLGLLLTGTDLFENIKGTIDADIVLQNNLNNPRPNGYLTVKNGSFTMPQYGIDYSNFELRIMAQNNRVKIDKIQFQRESGVMSASGYVDFDSTSLSGKINSSQLELVADKFLVARHKNFEIQISADAGIVGNSRKSEFSGTVEVLRSSFYLPAFLESKALVGGGDDASIPMLLEATQIKSSATKPLEAKVKAKSPGKSKIDSPFFDKLQGTLRISLPRNTWIKSPSLMLEIEGDLDLVKNISDIELFGSIKVVRGTYDIFGRRFTILEGNLIFKGGREFNPGVILEAEYVFRSGQERKTLNLNVSGELLNPTLNFILDGKSITQSDAVSYILFGRGLDQLSFGQQSELSQSAGSGGLVADVAAGMVSSELAKSIGRDLNLDILEIKSKDSWQSAHFVVGKYITNELFLSYERELGASSDNEAAPEIITVEYELTRNILFQLIEGSSKERGADLIFKVER